MRCNSTAIQWKYSSETEWHDLVALAELRGANGENGKDGVSGKNGTNGKNGTDGRDGTDGKNGLDGTDGADGKNGIDGKTIEVQKTDLYVQWRYKGGEWQNIVALSDITGPSGQNGKDGANGKTPEFRVEGNQLQWRYTSDTVWLNLYDLSALKGADGKNGENRTNGRDGKDGLCAGYFSAKGKVSDWNTALPLTVKKESGNLISYNPSGNKITLKKGHTYSLVFSGTVTVSAKGDDKLCGVSLIDGYNSSEMVLETRTYLIIPKNGQTARLAMAYNTVYTAENDITLTFQYTNMFFQYTDFVDSQYNITVIALD